MREFCVILEGKMANPNGAATVTDTLGTSMSRSKVWLLGIYLTITFLIQVVFLIGFWPGAGSVAGLELDLCRFVKPPCTIDIVTAEGRVIVVVLLAGGIGAMVHAVRSFGAHLGAQKLTNGWGWWYFLRPLEGAVVALAFYFVLGGGLVQSTSSPADSIYGIAGVAVLVGMFSHEAVTKLKEVAETFFSKASSVATDGTTASTLPKPTVTTLDPTVVTQGVTGAKITIVGTGFTDKSTARVQEKDRATEFKSATQIVVTLTDDDTKDANKELKISVVNPAPGGGESAEDKKVRVI
jgi:hypothetical protein